MQIKGIIIRYAITDYSLFAPVFRQLCIIFYFKNITDNTEHQQWRKIQLYQ
jgi:hypothetical protein